jgi:RNA polymerase sigma-70 factor (ECF subfamily)
VTTGPPHDPRDDPTLIEAINRGDADAFEMLYRRHRDWVVQLAWRFAGHQEDALDVLQETFSYVFRKTPHLALTASMRTFLYPAVKHLAIAARRKRLRQPTCDAPEALMSPIDPPPPGDPRSELALVVSGLPAEQREVLLMRFVDDLSLQEIAAALSLPEGTVKSRLHRALAALRADPRTARRLSMGP